MDPLTMQLILAGLQGASQVAPVLYKSPQEKADEEEARKLRRELEAGALGYSSADFTKDIGAQLAGTRGIREEAADRAAALQGTALRTGGGEDLLRAQAAQEKTAEMVAQAADKAAGRSMAKARQQEQRLYGLEAQKAQSQQDAIQGLFGAATTGFAATSEYSQAKQLIESQKISGEELEQFANLTGLDSGQAKSLYETMQKDPAMGKELLELLAAQNASVTPTAGG